MTGADSSAACARPRRGRGGSGSRSHRPRSQAQAVKIAVIDTGAWSRTRWPARRRWPKLQEAAGGAARPKLKPKQEEIEELQQAPQRRAAVARRGQDRRDGEAARGEGHRPAAASRTTPRRELNKAQRAGFGEIDQRVMPVINQVGKEGGYTLIFHKFESGLVYADEAVDITERDHPALRRARRRRPSRSARGLDRSPSSPSWSAARSRATRAARIEHIRTLETAGPDDLSFLTSRAVSRGGAGEPRGRAAGAGPALPGFGRRPARSSATRRSRSRGSSTLFHPQAAAPPGVHPTAVVDAGRAVDPVGHDRPLRGDRRRQPDRRPRDGPRPRGGRRGLRGRRGRRAPSPRRALRRYAVGARSIDPRRRGARQPTASATPRSGGVHHKVPQVGRV